MAIICILAITGYRRQMDAILDAIDMALRQKGLTDAAASKLAVGHPALIKNLRMPRDGEKRYNLPSLIKLAEVLDLEFYFGPRRLDPKQSQHALARNIGPDDDAPSGFVTIPCTGTGLWPGSAPVAFSRSWLSLHSLVPDHLQAAIPDLVAEEDSPPGDMVALLDTRPALRKGHGLWCFRDMGFIQVSNLTFHGEVTVVHPARSEDVPRVITGPAGGAISILGKVVWLGKSIPFMGKVG